MNVFPTSYFPSIAYLKALCSVESGVIDLGEHYVKQTFRNRCVIATANGKQDLSIPVVRPNGNKSSTGIVQVSPELNWRRDHWRTISAAYASSPYFEHYENEIKKLIFQDTILLSDFNKNCLEFVRNALDLLFKQNMSQEYVESPILDFRDFNFIEEKVVYNQVFNSENFIPNLSILDALFCLGPMARKLIMD